MSSTFSAALAADGASVSTGPDFARSPRSRSTNGAADSSPATSPTPGSTTTCEPSPPIACEQTASGQLTLFAEARPARTPAPPTPKDAGSTASVPASISKPSASSAKSDLAGARLRTFLASEIAGSTGFSASWKRQTTPHGRSWWVLSTSARRTFANGHGLLVPTPRPCSGLRSRGINQTEIQNAILSTVRANQGRKGNKRHPSLKDGGLGTADLLNWARWMMGYPKAWLAYCLRPTATPSSRKSLKSLDAQS